MTDAAQTTTTDQRLRLPKLAQYRAEATERRAAAFCDVPEYVLGMEVKPLTPATFSMLLAVGSHFLLGGVRTEGDVRNYIWFHSPLYVNCTAPDWRARKRKALRPLMRELYQPWWKRSNRDRYLVALALAVSDIEKLVRDGSADCPAGNTSAAPIATLEAVMVNRFAMAYGWTPERTRHTPLRQLFQLMRCHSASKGEDIKDAGEEKILADHLRERLAALGKTEEIS